MPSQTHPHFKKNMEQDGFLHRSWGRETNVPKSQLMQSGAATEESTSSRRMAVTPPPSAQPKTTTPTAHRPPIHRLPHWPASCAWARAHRGQGQQPNCKPLVKEKLVQKHSKGTHGEQGWVSNRHTLVAFQSHTGRGIAVHWHACVQKGRCLFSATGQENRPRLLQEMNSLPPLHATGSTRPKAQARRTEQPATGWPCCRPSRKSRTNG